MVKIYTSVFFEGFLMNYRLSCIADRVNNKNCYIIVCNGKVIKEYIGSFVGKNIKINILKLIEMGVRDLNNVVKHDDLVIVEIQNSYLQDWLYGLKYKKGYQYYLNDVYNVMDAIDCRFKFVYNKNPDAKNYMVGKEPTKVQYFSIEDAFANIVDDEDF